MLRRDRLCPKPEWCPDAQQEAGETAWGGEDLEPCANCPGVKLDEYIASPLGQSIRGALEIDFALRAGFTVTLDDVTAWEFGLLQLLDSERKRYEKQEMEKVTNKVRK